MSPILSDNKMKVSVFCFFVFSGDRGRVVFDTGVQIRLMNYKDGCSLRDHSVQHVETQAQRRDKRKIS